MLSRILQGSLALVGAVGLALATPRSLEPLMCDPAAFAPVRKPAQLCPEDHDASPASTGRVYLLSMQSGRLEAAYSRNLTGQVERRLLRSERALRNRSEPAESDAALPAPSAERWLEAPRWPWLMALGLLLAATLAGFGYAARRILLSPHPLLRNYSTREDFGWDTVRARVASGRVWISTLGSGFFRARGESSQTAGGRTFPVLRRKSSHSAATASAPDPASSRTAARGWRAG